jgi:signal transduction histidine kinase
MADKNKLLRVMDNLLENARKFTPKGGSIKAAIITEKTEIKVSITDTGMGLAPENLEKIFEKFYQVATAYTHISGGIGMGLTIAKEIIEAHNGKIRAESNGVGKGSAFIFTLPITV